ncbi:MAG: 50S ribosomal protein L9 [Phycisphaeraceae bacterium]|nr:50S ribosomal protein L9 [Phycisphaeraceae bacterium]
MARNVELLLTESVENLGIVGDVVKVRLGYARNFLLPRQLATEPSEELIRNLQAKRLEAERQLAEQRNLRAATIEKLAGYELHIERSCNDQGILYAGVTQQEIAAALNSAGFANIRPRDVRLNEAIKRVDTYTVHIKFETDLAADIKLWVMADRKLDTEEREEIEIDDEGEVVEKGKGGRSERPERAPRHKAPPVDLLEKPKTGWAPKEEAAPAAAAAEAPADGEKPKKAGKKAKG